MHMTIEQHLKCEARAAGMTNPMVTRQRDGSIYLYESPATLAVAASDMCYVATFTSVMDALANIGAVAAAYVQQNQSENPNERQEKGAAVNDGRA